MRVPLNSKKLKLNLKLMFTLGTSDIIKNLHLGQWQQLALIPKLDQLSSDTDFL